MLSRMIKLALAVMCLSTLACQKKDEPKPAPTEAPKPAEKPAEPAAKPAEPCVLAVKVSDKITFEGGGVKGESPLAAIDVSAVKPLAGRCSADLTADDTVEYQNLINVMDKLVQAGITDVGLGGARHDHALPPQEPTITGEWTTTKDGKLQLTGHFKDSSKDLLRNAPLIIMSRTEVKVFGKSVGKPDDSALGAAIAAALPASPKDPTVIIQADRGLPFATIRAATDAAAKGGYTNVLFAVKNK